MRALLTRVAAWRMFSLVLAMAGSICARILGVKGNTSSGQISRNSTTQRRDSRRQSSSVNESVSRSEYDETRGQHTERGIKGRSQDLEDLFVVDLHILARYPVLLDTDLIILEDRF